MLVKILKRLLLKAGYEALPLGPRPNAPRTSWLDPRATFTGNVQNIKIADRVRIEAHAMFECNDQGTQIIIGEKCRISSHAMLLAYGGAKLQLGDFCSVNPFTVLYGLGDLTIGNYVRIATHCVVVPANHVFDDPDLPITKQGATKLGITIEDDVWIGAGVRILDGCTIGKGSVIGAGTVLTKSVPEYSIVMGVPGRVTGQRGQKKST